MSKPLRVIMFSYERGFFDRGDKNFAAHRLHFFVKDDTRFSILILSHCSQTAVDDNPKDFNLPNKGHLKIFVYKNSTLVRILRILFRAIQEVRLAKKRGEAVIITAQDPFICGLLALIVSKIYRVPFELQEHGDFFSGYWVKENPVNRILSWIGRLTITRANHLRVVSERIASRFIDRFHIPKERITVLPVAHQFTQHLRDYENRIKRIGTKTPQIIVPCRFVKQKGLDVLIESLSILKKDGIEFGVRIVGRGPLQMKIMKRIKKLGLSENVEIVSWANKVSQLWRDADIFVCSSRYEGWGRTIAEAMARGLPVVTTDVGCVGSLLRPALDGLVVQPEDPVALANAIKEQIENTERGEWMCRNATQQIAKFFDKAVNEFSINDAPTYTFNPDGVRKQIEQMKIGWREMADHGWRKNSKFYISTYLLIIFSLVIRATSFLLFWKSLGANREWGFFSLVQNWFLGYGYSIVPALGCASAYRSPGYLFFLTGVYGLFGFANFFAQALIQNLLAVLLVYLVYRLGWAISKDRRIGLVAGFLIAVHPYAFYHYTQYYHTVISGVLLVGFLLALLALERTKRWRWAVLGGVLIAALAYIQGTILPATALLSLWLFIRWWPNWKRAIGAIAVMAIISVVMIAPWTYRNWTVFHAFVPLTTDLGHALAKANHPLNEAMTALGYPQEAFEEFVNPTNPLEARYELLPEVQADLRAQGLEPTESYFFGPTHPVEPGLRQTCADQAAMNEVAFNAYWMEQAKTWMTAHYWPDVVKLQIQKIAGFWSPMLVPGQKYGAAWSFGNEGVLATLVRLALALYVGAIEMLALAGLFFAARKKRLALIVPILLVFAVYTFMHSFFAGYTKYRIPLDNLLVVLSAFGIVGIWEMIVRKKK